MSSGMVRRPRVNRKTLVIGFDFGTHSTKVVCRERGKADANIVFFDEKEVHGYPFLTSPSLVRCKENRLFFGSRALFETGGQLYRSLKVTLLPGYCQDLSRFPDGLDNRCLVAAYFAWALQQLRQNLTEYAGARMFINLAAPMSHFEQPKLKNRYLQIIQTAWNLTFSNESIPVNQGISVTAMREVIVPALRQPVLSPEQRPFEVHPETIAPVVSLSLNPWMQPGMYMIVDTGAATTEMSVFHAGPTGADQKVLCYQDETMLIGGNDLHIAQSLEGRYRDVEICKITCYLVKQYRRIWHMGYQLDLANHHARHRWKDLTLVLSGGGTLEEVVKTRLRETNPLHPWPKDETHLEVCRHIPATLEVDWDMDENEISMFAVANGLAIERMHWPIVFQPDQIEHLSPTEKVEDKPLGYWYLDD